MDLFGRIRRDIGKIPWGAVASVALDELSARADSASELILELKEWGSRLAASAIVAWPATIALDVRCESPDITTGSPRKCKGKAFVVCDVCGRKCCLSHARIDYFAGAICEPCIGTAKARARRAAPRDSAHEESLRSAFRDLGLRRSASWDEVRAQYRVLVFKYNADRPQSDKRRQSNTERLQRVNAAYAVLRTHFEDAGQGGDS